MLNNEKRKLQVEFRMGKKLDRYRNLLILISLVITYGFCYIYGCLLPEISIQISTALLLLCFTALEGIVIFLLNKVIRFYRENFYYILLEGGLVICGSTGRKHFCWEDFQEARFDYTRIIGMSYLPVIFVANGQTIRLSKYIDGFNQLTVSLLKKIPDKVAADLNDKILSYK